MKSNKKSSVLVCVTGQYECDRLIHKGYELAQKDGIELHVLCVHTPISNTAFLSEEIEYLYQKSKNLGADMTIAFNKDAPTTAADFAKKIKAKDIVTGIPSSRDGFVDILHDLLPKSNITMVTKEGDLLTHCLMSDIKVTA
ncbi:MAG: hypothetical protein IJD68_02665 [Ruminococcus sp.]|nr:hypothetical protein [Ruminococcus sp.]